MVRWPWIGSSFSRKTTDRARDEVPGNLLVHAEFGLFMGTWRRKFLASRLSRMRCGICLPSDSVLHFLSLVALAAQAMTAALAAGRRSMDWAGVCMLGCITALGGGTIRDVLLGHYPLVWVAEPVLSRAARRSRPSSPS